MEDTDLYLSRCLKNWTERQKSHARSKESLLRLAAAPVAGPEQLSTDLPVSMDEYRCRRQQLISPPGMLLRSSFILSAAWPVDLTLLVRPTI